ncbi:hypothetical protein F5972_08230 [Microbispora cellulosiformans]|uniref:Uncharacterized protein n=1 Tax=Microbispora cellulosiformans TaxID=2614688 RepID=A0A5J5K4V8_9ACTN|nr:hypothetical protein [Microbispora cellulosiformans]KAA9379631.1 hypothetical protein F5972_08230 [Microbispora cellulosiformans]
MVTPRTTCTTPAPLRRDPTRDALYRVGPVRVAVQTDHPPALAHLGDFYCHADTGLPWWLVRGTLAEPPPGMRRDPGGAGYRADERERVLHIAARRPAVLQRALRQAVREVMLAHCETRRHVMIHAAAVRRRDLLLVFAGTAGAGKTTLAVDAVVRHGFDYVADDHLILYRDDQENGGGLVATGLPTTIPVGIGTYLGMEDVLPPPWDARGVNLDSYRGWPAETHRALRGRVHYTFASFGQPHPLVVTFGRGRVRVVVVQPERAARLGPLVEGGTAADLQRLLATGWVASPLVHPVRLPYVRRTPLEVQADGQDVLGSLCARARMLRWAHTGRVGRLLTALGEPLA